VGASACAVRVIIRRGEDNEGASIVLQEFVSVRQTNLHTYK
jgi:hypothetical protein